jgi:hypothetical protein
MVGEPVNVNVFQELAREALPKMYYDFYAGGAEDQYTLKDNVEAFHRIMKRAKPSNLDTENWVWHFIYSVFMAFLGFVLEFLWM